MNAVYQILIPVLTLIIGLFVGAMIGCTLGLKAGRMEAQERHSISEDDPINHAGKPNVKRM